MDDSFMDDDSSQRHHGQAQSGTHTHRDLLQVGLLPPPLQLAGDGAPAPLATAEVVDSDASQPAVDGTVAGSTTSVDVDSRGSLKRGLPQPAMGARRRRIVGKQHES
eukprot:7849361-Alexandrium_andersonii.AAC.1